MVYKDCVLGLCRWGRADNFIYYEKVNKVIACGGGMEEKSLISGKDTLEGALDCYGQVRHNTVYYTDRQTYNRWFSGALETLRARELRFKDPVECYMKICEELREN